MGMFITLVIAMILTVLAPLFIPEANVKPDLNVIAAQYDAEFPDQAEAREWELYRIEAVMEYEDEFTALFNSYETKWSKNGRLMIRTGNSGSFKFAKKGM